MQLDESRQQKGGLSHQMNRYRSFIVILIHSGIIRSSRFFCSAKSDGVEFEQAGSLWVINFEHIKADSITFFNTAKFRVFIVAGEDHGARTLDRAHRIENSIHPPG